VLGRFVTTFLVIFLAELPDKTMVATLVLTTRFQRPFWVWLGAAGGFLVQVTIAMLAGGLLSQLPDRPVKLAVAVLFAIGAVILWRQRDDPTDAGTIDPAAVVSTGRIVAVSFTTLLVAEVGDLTQLTIASLAASTGQPVAVFLGGLLALWTVAALAAVGGMAVLKRVPIRAVRTGAAVVFALLAVVSVFEALA
jgi:putative Ca2+/H+ antiporter (TMEM165/GDT1 family)